MKEVVCEKWEINEQLSNGKDQWFSRMKEAQKFVIDPEGVIHFTESGSKVEPGQKIILEDGVYRGEQAD